MSERKLVAAGSNFITNLAHRWDGQYTMDLLGHAGMGNERHDTFRVDLTAQVVCCLSMAEVSELIRTGSKVVVEIYVEPKC